MNVKFALLLAVLCVACTRRCRGDEGSGAELAKTFELVNDCLKLSYDAESEKAVIVISFSAHDGGERIKRGDLFDMTLFNPREIIGYSNKFGRQAFP